MAADGLAWVGELPSRKTGYSDRRGGQDCNDLPQLNPRIDVAEGRD